MKKNIIISMLVLMLAASAAGCGKTDDGGSALVDGTSATQSADSSQAESSQNTDGSTSSDSTSSSGSENSQSTGEEIKQETEAEFGDGADEKVDMDKIEGTEAKTDKSGTSGDSKMTNCEVEIDEVKIAPIDDVYMVVVQFDFKNKSSSELNFGGEVYVNAYQDGMELAPTILRDSIEGYSPDTTMQGVAPGDSIKVQRAFTTSDPNTPVEIYVRDTYDDSGKTYLAQVFRVE